MLSGCVGEHTAQTNLTQQFLTEEFGVTELERAPHFTDYHGRVTIHAHMRIAPTTSADAMTALQTLGFVRLCLTVIVFMSGC